MRAAPVFKCLAPAPKPALLPSQSPPPPWHFYHLVYAPVQPFNLLHTLRSIALKFKWHALAKHFNQRSRHAAQLSGEKEKRGRARARGSGSAFPLAAMRSLSLPLEHLELLVSCTYNNIFLPSLCHCVSLCVCVCMYGLCVWAWHLLQVECTRILRKT